MNQTITDLQKRRADNLIWNCAKDYSFAPDFKAYDSDGNVDLYWNIIYGSARRHFEYEKLEGLFAMLDKYKKCPHCGAEQKWGYHRSTAVAFILLAIGAAALAVLSAVVYARQVRGGNSDFTFLGCAIFLLFFGAMFIVRAAWDIKGLKAARGQSEQKPEVFFDQMTSPWLDRLKD